MKKIICLLLSALMIIGICGCGNGSDKTDGGNNPTKTETAYDHDEGATVLVSPQIGDVILENEFVKICYNDFRVEDSEYARELGSGELVFKEKLISVGVVISTKKDCAVLFSSGDYGSVNEFATYRSDNFRVFASYGKTENRFISMAFPNNLNLNDKSDIERISFCIGFEANFEEDKYIEDTKTKVVIYPNGKQTPAIEPIEETEDTKIIYDKDGIQMIIKNMDFDSKLLRFDVWVVNNSDKEFPCELEYIINRDMELTGQLPEAKVPPTRIKIISHMDSVFAEKNIEPSEITLQFVWKELNKKLQPTGKILKTDEFTIDIKK